MLPVGWLLDVVHLPEVSDILTSAADLVNAPAVVWHPGVVSGAPGTRPLCRVGDQGGPGTRLVTCSAPSSSLTNLRPRPHACDWSIVRKMITNNHCALSSLLHRTIFNYGLMIKPYFTNTNTFISINITTIITTH